MKQIDTEKLKKRGNFVFQRADALPHIIKDMENRFEKKPEGREVKYLRNIIEHYIKDRKNFIQHFISGEEGNRGVDEVIEGLDRRKLHSDRKIISRLRKLRKKLRKMRVPDIDEIQHYEILKQDTIRVSTIADLHEFIKRFNEILVRAVKYEDSDVAKAIKARSQKITPHIITLESFESSVGIWKLLLSRLYWPDIEDKALRMIGAHDFRKAIENMAKKMNRSPEEIMNELKNSFPQEKEDSNMTNIRAFAQKINSECKNNMFVKTLKLSGQKKYATLLLYLFGKKGKVVVDQKKTVSTIAKIIGKIESHSIKDEIELAAKKELGILISNMLNKTYKNADVIRKQFGETIADRIRQIEKKHAKDIMKIKKMIQKGKKIDREILMSAAAVDNTAKNIIALRHARLNFIRRTVDIVSLMRVRMLITQLMMGHIKPNEVMTGLKDLEEKEQPKFVGDIIIITKDIVTASSEGKLSADNMKVRVTKIYEYVDKLMTQLPTISEKQHDALEKLKKLSTEFEELKHAVEIDINLEYKARTKEFKELSKMGITEETYKETQAPGVVNKKKIA